MIIVYEEVRDNYTYRGLGPVWPTSCTISETLNGDYTLSMDHPVDTEGFWKRLKRGNIIRVTGPKTVVKPMTLWTAVANSETPVQREIYEHEIGDQYFKIREYSVSSDGKSISIGARHIFYNLADCYIHDLTYKYDTRPYNILGKFTVLYNENAANSPVNYGNACLDFNFYTNLSEQYYKTLGFSDARKTKCQTKKSFMVPAIQAITGSDGILKTYGGELLRDGTDVYILDRIGYDRSKEVCIKYGRNMRSMDYSENDNNMVTHLGMITYDSGGNEVVHSPLPCPHYQEHPENYPNTMVYYYNYSEAKVGSKNAEGVTITTSMIADMVETKTAELMKQDIDLPEVSITVSFFNYANAEEFKAINSLKYIYLGDTITVESEERGIKTSLRMTGYTYDVLKNEYENITLGVVRDNMYEAISRSFQ